MTHDNRPWIEACAMLTVFTFCMIPAGIYFTKHVGMGEALLFFDFLIGAGAVGALVTGAIASLPEDAE